MNTRPIPIIITLSAAGVSCVVSISQEVGFSIFLIRLAMTVGLFYVIGMVVALLLMRAFGNPGDSEVVEEEVEEEETEENPDEAGDEAADGEPMAEDISQDSQEAPADEFTPTDPAPTDMDMGEAQENINMDEDEFVGAEETFASARDDENIVPQPVDEGGMSEAPAEEEFDE